MVKKLTTLLLIFLVLSNSGFVRGDVKLILRPNFPTVLVHVKKSCEGATKFLVHELDGRFPNHDLMLALSVIYLNFWVDHPNDVKDVFH
jgi:hypothetical protein